MLLKADLLADIKAGKVDIVFRRWKRSTVKPGGTLMTSAGLLSIDEIVPITLGEVTLEHVRRAGFASIAAFHAWLDTMKDGDLCRIHLHYLGEDPRIAFRNNPDIGPEDWHELSAALVKLDGKAPWVRAVLHQIKAAPGQNAEDLAEEAGIEKAAFKTRVSKLKALGLTESLAVGYRLSPRGATALKRLTASV